MVEPQQFRVCVTSMKNIVLSIWACRCILAITVYRTVSSISFLSFGLGVAVAPVKKRGSKAQVEVEGDCRSSESKGLTLAPLPFPTGLPRHPPAGRTPMSWVRANPWHSGGSLVLAGCKQV